MNHPTGNNQVMTVLGPISADDLGVTLVHEHMVFGFPGWSADETIAPYERDAAETKCLEILKDVKAVGIQTIIDATPCDVGGRDAVLLKRLAEKSGIQIIAVTGLYHEKEGGAPYFKWLQFANRDIEKDIYELFKTELTTGIGKTGVRPGLIKVATDDPVISEYEQLIVRAAVQVSKETGVPIITHCQGDTVGPAQQDLFLKMGANPKRIMIGHQNNSADINYHLSQLKKPDFFIGFDRTGSIIGPQPEECVIELIKEGYADRLMISHDFIGNWLGRPFDLGPAGAEWYPTYIHKKLIPKMKAAGVTDAQIRTMLVDNPRRLFTGE